MAWRAFFFFFSFMMKRNIYHIIDLNVYEDYILKLNYSSGGLKMTKQKQERNEFVCEYILMSIEMLLRIYYNIELL